MCGCLPKYELGGSISLGPSWTGGAAPRVAGPYNPAADPTALTGLTTRFGRWSADPCRFYWTGPQLRRVPFGGGVDQPPPGLVVHGEGNMLIRQRG